MLLRSKLCRQPCLLLSPFLLSWLQGKRSPPKGERRARSRRPRASQRGLQREAASVSKGCKQT